MSWTCPRCHADYVVPRERCEADGWKLVENMVGRTIGERYFIEKLIGIGGMRSTIWRALQRPTDRPVAVKILPAASVEEAQRFERGARIASNLNHPHITTVHDYGTAGGTFYLVMELLEGHTLQHMLRQGNIGLLDTMVMVDQMLRALEHAHAMNVVHRDLKPSNLFVTKKNDDIFFVKILDFGLAKLATTGTESSSDEDDAVSPMEPLEETPHTLATGMVELNDITQAQRICGTPEYMAPEQILGAPLDRRTDLYALGVVLYRMVVGQLPFRSRVRHELYQQHLSSPPPPFPVTSNVPEPLQRLVMKALAKRPADRFADASEMRIALRAANRTMAPELGASFSGLFPSDASSTKPRSSAIGGSVLAPVTPPPRRRVWPLVALALLGGGGIATAIILSSRGGDSNTTARNDVPVEAPTQRAPAPPAELPPTPTPAASVAAAPQVAPEVVPEVTVVAGHGTVAFATKPSGAEVLRDGKSLGTTPLQLVLPSGEHTIELRATGYAPSVMPVTVVAGQQVKLDIELQAAGDRQVAAPENSPAITGARRRPVVGREASDQAPPTPIPTTSVLGRDVAAPPPAQVKVLGRDVNQEKPDVKILGSQVPSPEPKVKVLGQ